MASFLFGLMILLLLNSTKAPQNFETVSDCPRNASSWKIKSDKKDCKGDTPNYLCAAIENHVGKYGEICTQYGLTPVKKCAVLNAQTYNLDSVDCNAASGCPQDPYIPSELWKYPICFKDFYGTKPTFATGTTQTTVITDNVNRNATQNGHRSGYAGSGAGVVVAVVIILIIVIGVVTLVVFYVRNQFGFKDKVQQRITEVRNRLDCFKHRDDTVEHPTDGEAGVAYGPKKPLLNGMKLNPDCTVEKGIVITENITTALAMLESRNVVILKGVIGCGKTHALKAIQNHFQGAAYVTEWMEENIKWQEGTYKEKPTIILCDNFFGRFGCSVFSQIEVIKTGNIIKAIENAEKNIKVVIAIHTHVYEEVKSNKLLKNDFLHQKNITVDMDKLSEAETLFIFKTQQEKGHCKMNSDCWFKTVGFQSVLDKLTKNQGHIGSPFLSMMYCNQHELFSDELFSVNPVTSLKQHFQKIEQGSPMLYASLVYLMCVQEHKCEEEPRKWDKEIISKISKETLNEMANTSCFIRVENTTASLAHEILTIILFKFTAESNSRFLPVVKNCKVDLMLQILRPKTSFHCELYCDVMDVSKKSEFKNVGKIFLDILASNEALDVSHPLRSIKWVCKNYKTKK